MQKRFTFLCALLILIGVGISNAQNDTVTSFPYFEDFNSIDTANADYPEGWTVENLNGDSFTWKFIANTASYPNNAYSAPFAMHMAFGFSAPNDDWLFSKPVYLEAGVTYTISFYYKVEVLMGSTEKLELKWGDAPNATAMTAGTIFSDDNLNSTTYAQHENDITPATSGVYYFGFHSYSDAVQFLTMVDDFKIESSAANTGTDFLTYVMPEEIESAIIDTDNHTIKATVGTVKKDWVAIPTFTLSNGATAYIDGVAQESGVTEVTYLGDSVIYNVIAEDNTTEQAWKVELEIFGSVKELSSTSINVYPNPANDLIYINAEDLKEASIEIKDIYGRTVMQTLYLNNSPISINGLASGNYLICIHADHMQYIKRFTKK